MAVEVQTRCCEKCKTCICDFKKVDEPSSGLVIQIHTKLDDQNESPFNVSKGIIFHNTTDKELSKPNYLMEVSQYTTKYSHIKIIIKRVRSLIDEIVVIKGNQVIGICEHCKRANTTKKCRKCTYMVREFLADKKKIIEDKQKRFKEWLLKVKHLLQYILNAHCVCKDMAYKDNELERILRELKTPLSMRIPNIDSFLNVEGDQIVTQSITESKEMLDELLSRIQSEGIAKPLSSNDSLYPFPPDYKETCICKLVKEGHFLENEISTWSADKTETCFIDSISEADYKKENALFLTDLLQRLQDLKRELMLDSFKTADKVLIQNLLKSINYVHKQGLLPAYTKKLIDQISQLSKVLSFDGKSGERHKSLIDSLLTDLKKNMIMTEGVSKHLIKALTYIFTRTADEFSKGADAEESPKNLSKDQSYKPSTAPSKDASNDLLRQKLLELARVLSQGLYQALDKELVGDLSNKLKQTINKDTLNVTQGIIGALTDVCKVLAKGIPKNLNERPVIDILEEMNEIFTLGLTSDQNKEKLQTKLRELGKALTQTITKETNKEEISKIKSKSVTTVLGTSLSKGPTKVQANEQMIQKTKKTASSGIKSKTDASGDATSVSKGTVKETRQEKPKKVDLSQNEHVAQKKTQKEKESPPIKGKEVKEISKPIIGSQNEHVAQKKTQKEKESPPIKGKELKEISKPIIGGKKAEDKNKSKEEIGKKRVKEQKPIKEKALKEISKAIITDGKKQVKEENPSKVKTKTKDEKDTVKEIKKSKSAQEDLLFTKPGAEKPTNGEQHIQKQKEDKKEKSAKKLKSIKAAPKTVSDIKRVESITATDRDTGTETDSSRSFDYKSGQADTKYIIIGTSLKPRTEPKIAAKPLFLKKEIIFEETPEITFKELSEENKVLDTGGTGIIEYRLSDREFIDNGWTKLPTKKTMRRMNIYRMHPACPQYDWFKINREKKVMFYDTGEKLAEITDNGRGKWFYKNGAIALEYYDAEEMLVGQRYIVFSSGEECESGRRKSPTVLALFDFLGNGVVYDYNGNVRLKYNQSEGVVVDPKIGPPSRWMWHTLNEPPVLQHVYVNSHLAIRDPFIEQLGPSESQSQKQKDTQQSESVMLQIELDNFVKEKSQKLLQKYKPFQIKMKAMKLNEQFSLKILDQANIYLLLRDGRTTLKLNLGMNLNNHEIIDTDISDATGVSTPYDKFPAKTDSITNIQSILQSIRKANKSNLRSFSSCTE